MRPLSGVSIRSQGCLCSDVFEVAGVSIRSQGCLLGRKGFELTGIHAIEKILHNDCKI